MFMNIKQEHAKELKDLLHWEHNITIEESHRSGDIINLWKSIETLKEREIIIDFLRKHYKIINAQAQINFSSNNSIISITDNEAYLDECLNDLEQNDWL